MQFFSMSETPLGKRKIDSSTDLNGTQKFDLVKKRFSSICYDPPKPDTPPVSYNF